MTSVDQKELRKNFDMIFKIAEESKNFWDDSAAEQYRKRMREFSEEVNKLLEEK